MDQLAPQAWVLLAAGFLGGLLLFVRGLVAYRHDRLIEAVATSHVDAIAAGEVRVSGVIEAVGSPLVSPLQSRPCVWYRARVDETGKNGRTLLDEERSREFTLRDATGSIRVLPRGARWEVDLALDASTGLAGDEPPELRPRSGAGEAALTAVSDREVESMSALEREAAVQALLSLRPPRPATPATDVTGVLAAGAAGAASDTVVPLPGMGMRRRRYREARLEVGETVTLIGQALPWGDARELLEAWRPGSNVDRAMAADIAAARAAGILAASPAEAWGNAAIPGFGIGRPTEMPDLHPEAAPPPVVEAVPDGDPAARGHLRDEELVISRGHGTLVVYRGTPQLAEAHHDPAFVLGVIGGMVAVGCAVAAGALLTGTL